MISGYLSGHRNPEFIFLDKTHAIPALHDLLRSRPGAIRFQAIVLSWKRISLRFFAVFFSSWALEYLLPC